LIIKHLSEIGVFPIYILKDDVSKDMAKELYPLINEVETMLREYLIKFGIKTYGTQFWDEMTSPEMREYKKRTISNLSEFEQQVYLCESKKDKKETLDLSMFCLEFRHVGEIIYKPIYTVSELEKEINNSKDINELKKKIAGNYDSFFKETFKDKGFQEKWEKLVKIRHKVAHNSLFTKEKLKEGKGLAEEIINIIDNAIKELDKKQFMFKQPQVNEPNSVGKSEDMIMYVQPDINEVVFMDQKYSIITEDKLLEELERSEEQLKYSNRYTYVGLRSFVTKVLAEKNYAIGPSYAIINKLNEEKKIEIYKEFDEQQGDVKAIRIYRE
jgi:hypothetical protein